MGEGFKGDKEIVELLVQYGAKAGVFTAERRWGSFFNLVINATRIFDI